MIKHLPIAFGVMLALTGTAGFLRAIGGNPYAATVELSEKDKQFLTRAGQAAEAEVALAKLARDRSKNDQVKALAGTIQRDHEAANAELKKIAQKYELVLAPLSVAQKAAHDTLDKLSGPAWDQAFLAQMAKDHNDAIALFTQGTKSSNAEVKAFAEGKLPALKAHLKAAQSLQKA